MKQIARAKTLIARLTQLGVEDFILCAGARNAPLVKVLGQAKGVNVLPFFDERAAAFFAVGRIQASGRPVAVITTSGTAVAELLPATVEAWYSALPLVLVTADRPSHFRGSGAPQTIEQIGIFSHYVGASWDLVETESIHQVNLALHQPTHINICFDEPLVDEEVSEWWVEQWGQMESMNHELSSGFNSSLLCFPGPLENSVPSTDHQVRINQFLTRDLRPLVIVGRLSREEDRCLVESVLLSWKLPVYLEAPSGLRESEKLCSLRLESGEGIFAGTRFAETFNGVIRIGGVPTLRMWRDLEKKYREWPVLSFSREPFSGLGRDKREALPLHCLTDLPLAQRGFGSQENVVVSNERGISDSSVNLINEWIRWDRQRATRLRNLLERYPRSEPGIFAALSALIPPQSLVFLGNSSPIREWDLAADWASRQLSIFSNRGANGIDGLFSSFLGASTADQENWAIIGDLSALYDLNAPWALGMARGQIWRMVIINNFGGKIFRRMFAEPLFENRHCLNFQGFAQLWNLHYYQWHEVASSLANISSPSLIEIQPDLEATDLFWHDYFCLDQDGVDNCC